MKKKNLSVLLEAGWRVMISILWGQVTWFAIFTSFIDGDKVEQPVRAVGGGGEEGTSQDGHRNRNQVSIPDICHFYNTHTFRNLNILHSKIQVQGSREVLRKYHFFYRIFFGTLPSVESMTTNIYAVCCTLPSIQSLYKKEHFIFVQTWPRQESKLTNTSSLEELEKSVLWNSTETTRTNALS